MRRPLRVAVLADTLPPLGHSGVGMAQSHVAAALKREGLEVKTFAFLELPRVWKYTVKGVLRSLLWVLAWVRCPWRRPGLRLELDTALLGALSGRALFGRVRMFDPDFVLVPDFGAAAALWPIAWRRKLVVVAHSGPLRFLDRPLIGKRDPLDAHLAFALERRMSREARASVVPSEAMRRAYECDYPLCGPVAVISNMLDETLLASIAAQGPDLSAFKYRIFLPSAGNPNKGRAVLEELLESLASLLAPRRVVFVVSGALDKGQACRLRGLPSNARLYAPGPLPNAQNLALMKSCQICVSPTLIESFGMALLEAQFCGLPVVCFDVEATSEVVLQGKTGCLVAFADTQALARESAALLRDPRRLARFSRAAARRARSAFSFRLGGRSYARLLRSLGRS